MISDYIPDDFQKQLYLVLMRRLLRYLKYQKSSLDNNVNLSKDYYKILQIQQNACQNTIKKSYIRLAKKYHPDYNSKGHQKFTEIQQAYNVLSSEDFKEFYDCNSEHFCMKDSQKRPAKKNSANFDDLNYRNEQFFRKMKGEDFNNFKAGDNKHYNSHKGNKRDDYYESSQEEEQRKRNQKIEDQIKLTRKLFFSNNPIWERANAYMSYEERQKKALQKEKQLQHIFGKIGDLASIFKKW